MLVRCKTEATWSNWCIFQNEIEVRYVQRGWLTCGRHAIHTACMQT